MCGVGLVVSQPSSLHRPLQHQQNHLAPSHKVTQGFGFHSGLISHADLTAPSNIALTSIIHLSLNLYFLLTLGRVCKANCSPAGVWGSQPEADTEDTHHAAQLAEQNPPLNNWEYLLE